MTSQRPFPPLYLITPEPAYDRPQADFLQQLEASLRRGIRLVQFRAKTLSPDAYRALAIDVLACCRQYDALLLLNAEPGLLEAIDADGVHLDGARLAACDGKPPISDKGKLVGAACHSLEQLRQAKSIAADFVTLSPVLPTGSHPGVGTLGWDGFAELVKQTRLPVYALGGMDETMLEHARAHGAYGVAGIQAFWG